MNSAQIVVTVRADGTIEAETVGVTGEACLDYIRVIEDLIEGTTVSSQFTADFHAGRATAHTQAPVIGEVNA